MECRLLNFDILKYFRDYMPVDCFTEGDPDEECYKCFPVEALLALLILAVLLFAC